MDASVLMPDTMLGSGTSPTHIWIPGIVERIACFLPRNEAACCLRVVDKATAAMLQTPTFTTVRLSEPVPHHAFSWRWGRPGAMRDLTMARRRELLRLTAASGDTANLALAARVAGCPPTKEVAEAAGKSGQLGSVLLLEELGCDMDNALRGAAAGGHLALCEELVCRGCSSYEAFESALEAAEGGHLAVVDSMVQLCAPVMEPGTVYAWSLVARIATGCDLATLQRFFREWTIASANDQGDQDDQGNQEDQGNQDDEEEDSREYVLMCAAGSPTPDWRAKVEWLEAQGFARSWHAFSAAVEEPDAVERLEWLIRRGYPCGPEFAAGAALAGNADAVLYVATRAAPDDWDCSGSTDEAACLGHLSVLQALHAAGRRFDVSGASRMAAGSGHLHVLAWLVEALGLDAVPLDEELFEAAAGSGSVELMAWLRERGCPWGGRAYKAAVESGCEAALEWLAERGCPMPADGSPFLSAANHLGATVGTELMERLWRLGCPWGPVGHVFNACIAGGGGLSVLTWLAAVGCPVDWCAAVAAAEAEAGTGRSEEPKPLRDRQRVLTWVRSEAGRRQA
ncbi:hypothetical protein GPECTOR_56g390 [Gonium pectorale]|uniref:Ankyrin repeat domain-containing protein n=1 Tax=Gonium pectorale TaxID=33097 RepID=A0A150G646_GONPE|nr:hypothetical protein GPECTOR_56g390 [Gonium pectorale]|eukprot:KXZ45294.1 hypothetical protein GPECTOR_56g390 [Gonium pectorale]